MTKMKWIPCNERLPEKDGEYLVDYGGIAVLPYEGGWNCFKDYTGRVHRDNEIHAVKAWMKLPKPYEKE